MNVSPVFKLIVIHFLRKQGQIALLLSDGFSKKFLLTISKQQSELRDSLFPAPFERQDVVGVG